MSPQKAVETIVYLASNREVREITGKYFRDNKKIKSSLASHNIETASDLWLLNVSLTGIDDLQF